MSPTFDATTSFLNQFRRLSNEEQTAFMVAVRKLVTDLRTGKGFRKSLRIKKYQGAEGVYEMSWAPDGRALFRFGAEVQAREQHVIWLAVGGHEIFDRNG